jgi:hypothetical protein
MMLGVVERPYLERQPARYAIYSVVAIVYKYVQSNKLNKEWQPFQCVRTKKRESGWTSSSCSSCSSCRSSGSSTVVFESTHSQTHPGRLHPPRMGVLDGLIRHLYRGRELCECTPSTFYIVTWKDRIFNTRTLRCVLVTAFTNKLPTFPSLSCPWNKNGLTTPCPALNDCGGVPFFICGYR